jgi:hypothetical protein
VIHGAEDRYVPAANAVALAEAIPGSRLMVLEEAGHLVFIERFADVNREVVTFIKPREARKKDSQTKPETGLEARCRGALRKARRWVERVGLVGP